ncbi:MAG: hypothetical protein RQ862_09285 [Candidatus Caldarchaeales archaeon]|nr:hypothetical protein [Candidatus Caldarchaeales archaeon]
MPGGVEGLGRRVGAAGVSPELAEDLLDLLLTTYNSAGIGPEAGIKVAQLYMSGRISSPEGMELLLRLCAAVEPEKTVQILRKHGLNI